jgi:hypothetical protein
MGSNIELFQYSAPDQRREIPKNSDIGGHHIAFYVDDIAAAVAYLKAQGVQVLAGPLPVTEGPAAGQTINYFLAPWGLQLELISYPRGMAYEAGGSVSPEPSVHHEEIPCPNSIVAASCRPAAPPRWPPARSPACGSPNRPMPSRSTRSPSPTTSAFRAGIRPPDRRR